MTRSRRAQQPLKIDDGHEAEVTVLQHSVCFIAVGADISRHSMRVETLRPTFLGGRGAGAGNANPSTTAGTPLPDAAGSWMSPSRSPPNSPVTMPRCVPGATAIPLVPAENPSNSGNVWNWLPVSVHVPAGVPGVNSA